MLVRHRLCLSFGGLSLFMAGRFIGSWIMRRVRAEKMLFWCATGTVVSTVLVVLRLGTDFLYRPALLLCVRGNYVPHYLCSFTERTGQSHQACFILPDDVSGRRGSRSVADGLCCRLLNHEYGFHCSLPWLCGGMAVCPPHVAGERISCVVFYTPTLHCLREFGIRKYL